MAKPISLTINGISVVVPEGTLVVEAAKKAGVDIPVFCYHPKMAPVGMCRMCLVEIGRTVFDRTTGAPVLDEAGKPQVFFSGKLETSCTTPAADGMVVLDKSERVDAGRKDILEFLLTSHPLDCPICDKGGECPLQNLTMGFGPGESRFVFDDKKHLAKQVQLGDLIVLDRERCIQCGRCVRFQQEIVDDPVIGFSQRGRSFEIVSFSNPGFDSIWSGNTTDICPVGALTTSDFRFRARPWELRYSASICSHCPVGCNITLNLRREAASGGDWVVKRVLPRQNEGVNEIWICNKGRFGYHYAAQNSSRLRQPLVRKSGELVPASWEEALCAISERLQGEDPGLLTLAGGRLSNEDLYNLKKLTDKKAGRAVLYSNMGGGELTTQLGIIPGSNLGGLGKDAAILVVACDLEQEAPVWWLRVKQAAERGARLIVLNARRTKLDRWAEFSLRYPFGSAAGSVLALVNAISAKRPDLPEALQEFARSSALHQAARVFSEAADGLVIYGSDGMGLADSTALAEASANLLLSTGHVGRPNNGLMAAWQRPNDQGAWELGWRPAENLMESLQSAKTLYIAAADPVGDDSAYLPVFGAEKFVIVQDLYLSQTARLADVVLPAQSWIERSGSFTSGERRVQRFYPAVSASTALPPQVEAPGTRQAFVLTGLKIPLQGPQADYSIPALVAQELGIAGIESENPSTIFRQIAEEKTAFEHMSYQKLAEVQPQWPIVGRSDLYYGGTSYENTQGLGVQLAFHDSSLGSSPGLTWPKISEFRLPNLGLMAFPITQLSDLGTTMLNSPLGRLNPAGAFVIISKLDAERLKIGANSKVRIVFNKTAQSKIVQAKIDADLPERVVLVPRSYGMPVCEPGNVEIWPAS